MRQQPLTLNVAPLEFEGSLALGTLPWPGDDAYRDLRERHRDTHVFRFSPQLQVIHNIGVSDSAKPLGEEYEADPAAHLFLLGKTVQRLVLNFLAGRFGVLRPAKPLLFWGGRADSRLLSRAASVCGAQVPEGLEVFVKYLLDTRVIRANTLEKDMLCVLVDVSTSNQIEIPVSRLVQDGFDVRGRWVCGRRDQESQTEEGLLPRLDSFGRILAVSGTEASLVDSEVEAVSATDLLLEPRIENFEAVAQHYLRGAAPNVLAELAKLRQAISTADAKLAAIEDTLNTLRDHVPLTIYGGFRFRLSGLLRRDQTNFPDAVSTERPVLLFGAQGRNQGPSPDAGISKWGPYRYSFFPKNDVTIGVICENHHRGRVEQFVQALRNGYPEQLWRGKRANPYPNGLVGKFRLGSVRLTFEVAEAPTASAYAKAVRKLLDQGVPDLAIVQTRTVYRDRFGDDNPYLVAKAGLMTAGVPVQSVEIETIEGKKGTVPYILNNIALASYAKLGGTPWVMAVPSPTSHEIVLGLGYTETGQRGTAGRRRYVAITTVFQGDGRYLVWGRTREVEFENYAEALLENLRATIGHVRGVNNWQAGDRVRLICHVYKHLKHQEMHAIKQVAAELTGDQFEIEYAFVDLSRFHSYYLFEPAQKGVGYGAGKSKGAGVPPRGTCLRMTERSALLHLTGPGDLKTGEQGLPQPLLIDLHTESDFTDLVYLVRQIYHFSYMSWRSFFPGTEPVTIQYSRSIAQKLASLRPVTGWNSSAVLVGTLRESKWFL